MKTSRMWVALVVGLLLASVVAPDALAQGAGGGRFITIDMEGARLKDVLDYIKGQGGPDFVLEAGVDPNTQITLRADNQPLDDILQAVIDSAGLSAVRDGDMLHVRKRQTTRQRTQRADATTGGVQLPTGAGVTSRPEPSRAAGAGATATGAAATDTADNQTRRIQLRFMETLAWGPMLSGILGSQMGMMGGGMGGGGGGGWGGGGNSWGGGGGGNSWGGGGGGNSWGGGGNSWGGGGGGFGGGGGGFGGGGGGRSSRGGGGGGRSSRNR